VKLPTQLLEQQVIRATHEIITEPSDRDEQVKIGPSDMATDCLYCLGRKMAGEKIGRWTMFPWLGTAIHTLIEKTRDRLRPRPGFNDMAWQLFGEDRAEFEKRVEVCTIPGYGTIYGSIDVFLRVQLAIVDWKSSSKKKVSQYKTNSVPLSYVGQLTMYMHALRLLGYDVTQGVLVFIPRDAAKVEDIWTFPVEYQEQNALSLIKRCTDVFAWVRANRHHELPKHADCYNCFPRYFG